MTKCLGTPEQLVVYPLRGQCSPFCGGVRSSVAVHWILCVLFVFGVLLVAIRLLFSLGFTLLLYVAGCHPAAFFKIWIISAAALFFLLLLAIRLGNL